jgi:nitrite reductase/ring-hydroxylating ferredoxin subunit
MGIDRRTVLAAGGIVAAGAVVAACSSGSDEAPAASSPTTGAAEETAAASAGAGAVAQTSDIPVGGGVILDEPAVVVTQPAEGEFKAFTAICPHQGCLVSEVADNEIVCPCHGSVFSAADGAVIAGPAQVGLEPAGIVVEGGSVVLS